MHFLAIEHANGESRLPARVCPALTLTVRGGGGVMQLDGTLQRYPRFMLGGATMSPRHTVADPGTQNIFVMFRPGALQQVLGISAADITSRALDMRDIIDTENVDRFLQQLDEDRPLTDQVKLLQDFLLTVFNLDNKRSIGTTLATEYRKLFSPMVDIASAFGISERQLERKVQQAFGLPLRDMRRIVRFGLTLPQLLAPSVAWGDLTHIAQECGYYDQAHMHREFTDLSGLGPIELVRKIKSDDPAYWMYRIPQPDFNRLFIPAD
jgi:AraC-like DNA-binding protein